MSEEIKLLPCPMCNAALVLELDEDDRFFRHPDSDCPLGLYGIYESQAKLWNTRAESALAKELAEALDGAMVVIGSYCFSGDPILDNAKSALLKSKKAGVI